MLRLELAAPFVPRITNQAVELCGKTILAGALCHLALGAVNRAGRKDSADRIPEYSIAEGFQPQVEWPSNTLHLTSLPLVFPGGASR